MHYRLDYRPDLDGLRAVAVVPVILYHLGVPYVPGGFVGVDIFFVLSGYFITRLIARDLSANHFSLVRFYDRRIRRLFPALIVMLTASSTAATLLLLPDDLERFGLTLAGAALGVSNFVFLQQSGYFAPASEALPLLHTWSLAVEEQFYLVFPVLMMLLWRLGRSHLVSVVVVLTAVSFVVNVWAVLPFPEQTFYMLPTRAWELGLGGLLALYPHSSTSSPSQRNLAAAAGLSFIVVAILNFQSSMSFPGIAAMLPCLGCALVVWAGQPSVAASGQPEHSLPLIGNLLAWRPFVFIGLISYSLYLWHWPVIVFTKYGMPGPLTVGDTIAVLLIIFLAAVISWRLIEQPLRSGNFFWRKRSQRFAYGFAASLTVAVLGGAMYWGDGFPNRLPQEVLAVLQDGKDWSPERRRCHADRNGRMAFSDTCLFGSDRRNVVMFADSHGTELSYALSEVAAQHSFSFRQITASACPPALDFNTPKRKNCNRHVETMVTGLVSEAPSTVILTAAFFIWEASYDKMTRDRFWRGFEGVIGRLRKAGHEIVILGDVPPHPFGSVPQGLAKAMMSGREPQSYKFSFSRSALQAIDTRMHDLAAKHSALYLPILPLVCSGSELCAAHSGHGSIYFDDHHLTVNTARRVVETILLPVLAKRAD